MMLMSSDRVMRWRLLLEEYGPNIIYIEGKKNIVADFFSRYEKINTDDPVEYEEIAAVEPTEMEVKFPMIYENVRKEQQKELRKNRQMRVELRRNKKYQYKVLEGFELIMLNNRIYVPKSLRRSVLDWYHHFLCHPGVT